MELKEKEDNCFIPEKNNPYPLCIGQDLEKCKDCQLRADWEPKDPYGVERKMGLWGKENMERLTRKSDTSDMVWFIDREHKSGYTEREPCDMDAHHARLAIAKLAEYEDLEEQGKLLKLPCAVGDMTYNASKLFGKVVDAVVERIEIDSDGFWVITSFGTYSFEDFGKTVFLTREEAEATLKELECKHENTSANT